MHAAAHLDRTALRRLQGQRLSRLLVDTYGRNPFYRRKFDDAGIRLDALRFPADLPALPLHHQGRADCRPGSESALGDGAQRAARALHALLSDLFDDRSAAALDRHERELAMDARLLEDGVSRRRASDRRSRVLSVLVRTVSGLLGGVRGRQPDGPALRARRRDVEPGAAGDDRAVEATVVCCTPTYALRLAEVAAAGRPDRPLAANSVRL